jgi:hypothetical protein
VLEIWICKGAPDAKDFLVAAFSVLVFRSWILKNWQKCFTDQFFFSV